MTEKQWGLSKDANEILGFLQDKTSHRKLRLFACACCYRVRYLFPDRALEAVAMSERFGDGDVSVDQLNRAAECAAHVGTWWTRQFQPAWDRRACHVAQIVASPSINSETVATILDQLYLTIQEASRSLESWLWNKITKAHVALLRESFIYPLRPISLSRDCITPTVQNLAETAYQNRDFDILPILADALEDAGCTDADILSHCRGPGPHVRGCWVIDLLLGKK